jgi:acetyl esterase/lipase
LIVRLLRQLSATLLVVVLLVAQPLLMRAQGAAPAATPAAPPAQPTQPATGPGGAEAAYDGLLAQHFGPEPDGTSEPTGYWLFEPTRPRSGTSDGPLPLVIFLHGYTGTDPEIYHAWIDHIVRRGAIVIYPDWQPSDASKTDNARTLPDMTTAIRAALAELRSGPHAQPDLNRVALVGHSFGGMLGVQYAAMAAAEGLPVPKAILLASPGCWGPPFACGPVPPLADLGSIPATTRLLILALANDPIVGTEPARLWTRLSSIPLENRDFITYVGDSHGEPALHPSHDIPATTLWNPLDAYDWYGTWKWFDALMSCSFADQDCNVALGNTPEQRSMGAWSDGTPVAEPIITDDPGAPMTAAGTPMT